MLQTHTHTEYVTLITFPRQKWLRERASVLCSTLPVFFFYFWEVCGNIRLPGPIFEPGTTTIKPVSLTRDTAKQILGPLVPHKQPRRTVCTAACGLDSDASFIPLSQQVSGRTKTAVVEWLTDRAQCSIRELSPQVRPVYHKEWNSRRIQL
jgi:hypothetical protein